MIFFCSSFLPLTSIVKEWRRVLNYQNLPKLKGWGLEVNSQMIQLDARVLNPPKVTYRGGKTLNAAFG